MNGILSIPSLYNFEREGISPAGLLKRYAILFENVIFNRHGAPIGRGEIAESLAEFVSITITPNGDWSERKSLGRNKQFRSLLIDCWDMVDDANKFESMRFDIVPKEVGDRLSEFCFREVRKHHGLADTSFDFDIDDVKELNGDIRADIGLNLLALSNGMDVMPSYSPIVGRALEAETSNLGGQSHELFNSGLLVPDFEEIGWNDILELRQDPHIAAFRHAVYDILSTMAPLNERLQTKIQTDLWNLAAEVKPNVRQSLLGAIGSNLPSPIGVNPIGVGLALKEIFESRQRAKTFGHVFFVQKLRAMTTNDSA